MGNRKKDEITIRSSTAEYLTYIASTGNDADSIEMRYEEESIWLTQRMMATLYNVSIPAINQHIKKIFEDGELNEKAVIKKYLITASDGKSYWAKRLDIFLEADELEILQDAGKITAEIAKDYAETEFEKYRIVQDRLFMSDFDKYLLECSGTLNEEQ